MEIFIVFMLALIVHFWSEKSRLKIKSDQDLIQRYMIFEHRRTRKLKGLKPIF